MFLEEDKVEKRPAGWSQKPIKNYAINIKDIKEERKFSALKMLERRKSPSPRIDDKTSDRLAIQLPITQGVL